MVAFRNNPPGSGEFPVDPGLVYLNHAAVAPWPVRTRDAVAAFAAENTRSGAAYYPRWLQVEQRLRRQLAWLVNAPSPDDIALLKNTSEGISLVAAGLPWQAGDNLVISNREFPSNRMAWEALAARGVQVRVADLGSDDPEAAVCALLDDRTRVLAISAVQFGDGLRLDLARLGRACRANGTLFCVDAIQQVGALAFDVQAIHADFAIADGHKWMLGPEGVALFYANPAARDQLALTQFGWHMVEHPGDYSRTEWTPAASARRFEAGSPNMLGIHALSASLSLFEETGMASVEAAVLANADFLARETSSLPGWTLLSRRDAHYRSGIVTVKHASGRHAEIFRLLRDEGMVCAERGDGIRLSPHFWNERSTLERAVALLEKAGRNFPW